MKKSEETHRLAYIANQAGLTESWCSEAFRSLVALENAREAKVRLRRTGQSSDDWNDESLKKAIQEDQHEGFAANTVRPVLLKALSLYCWESLIEFTASERLFGLKTVEPLAVQRELARRLGVNESTRHRWENGDNSPDGDTLLGAVYFSLPQYEMNNVRLHSRFVLVPLAACHVITAIRFALYTDDFTLPISEDKPWNVSVASKFVILEEANPTARKVGLPVPQSGNLDALKERFFAVSTALADSDADALLPTQATVETCRTLLPGVLKRVLCAMHAEFPNGKIRTTVQLREVFADWSLPYALFRIGLVSGFRDTDDPDDTTEQNWGNVHAH